MQKSSILCIYLSSEMKLLLFFLLYIKNVFIKILFVLSSRKDYIHLGWHKSKMNFTFLECAVFHMIDMKFYKHKITENVRLMWVN